ncbi:uncharacterized protein JCM15063_001227 [Sporobolomyces koalae]|uniref:uncharacterized protein n=1 Tax=Sporobolomyces koalae TaxID=500713 RepID=UPI00316B78EE
MPLGHRRFNTREQDPNDHITFIRSLPSYPDHEDALHLLKCLAAQFKPVMKEWGFGINSFVEYEPNPVFAGRNWNAGEIVEIVLRRKSDGRFLPWNFLLYVMAHECAHIREMNHSAAFQKVNTQLRGEIAALRQRGYTGDGFYGQGRTLHPDYDGNDRALARDETFEYTCGGAVKKKRRRRRVPAAGSATSSKPRRERGSTVTLGTTGRQTRIARKPGGRVTRKDAFVGQGIALGADIVKKDEEGEQIQETPISMKGRRTQSNTARAARDLAASSRLEAEKRAKAIEDRLRGSGQPESSLIKSDPASGDEEEDEWEFEQEDDEDKPEIRSVEDRYDEDEKAWLRDEMRTWDLGTSSVEESPGHGGAIRGQKRPGSNDLSTEEKWERAIGNDLAEIGAGRIDTDSDDDIIIVEPENPTVHPRKKGKIT